MSRTQSPNRHVTEAACPRIGAAWAVQAPMADHVRPSTGAWCVSSARRNLCGGEWGTRGPVSTGPWPRDRRQTDLAEVMRDLSVRASGERGCVRVH
jgi:hypothetical protein